MDYVNYLGLLHSYLFQRVSLSFYVVVDLKYNNFITNKHLINL